MIKTSLLLTFIFFFATSFVLANNSDREKKSAILPAEETVETDYFGVGDTVQVYGTVQGDAYVAGGQVTVDGTIENDLLAAGGDVLVQGNVLGDVRVAGGNVVISGEVAGNITAVGGNVMIAENAVLGGNIVGGGGSFKVFAPVEGSVRLGAGAVNIGNTINGDVYAGAEEITLAPGSAINGNFTYMSEQEVYIPTGATVSGQILREETMMTQSDRDEVKEKAEDAFEGGIWVAKIINVLSVYILGLLLLYFFPRFFEAITTTITTSPWKSMGVGFLTLIVTPILAFILMLTVIGIPFGFIVLFGYFIGLYVAKLFVSMVLGEKVLGYLKASLNRYLVLFVGLILYLILSSIPILGGLVVFVTLISGLGGAILGKKNIYNTLHAKKLL